MCSSFSLIVFLVSISIATSTIISANSDSYQKSHPLITKAKIVKNVYKLVSPKVYRPKFKIQKPIIYLPKLQFEKPKVYLPKFQFKKPKIYLPKLEFEKPKKYYFLPQYSLMPKFKIGPAVKLGLTGLKIGATTALALPMTIGAAIGAPAGAIVGAKIGAVKGALIGKAILIKKGILLVKGTKMAAKAIKKPILLLYKAKKKLVKVPGELLAYGVGLAKKSGNHIKSIIPTSDNLNLPKFPAIPISLPISISAASSSSKGPKSLEAYYRLNHPWIGKQFGKIELTSIKKKREVTNLDSKNFTQIIELVRKHKAEACVMRLVCELSIDSSKYGSDGVQLVSTFTQMRSIDSTGEYQAAYDVAKVFNNTEECIRRFPCEMKMPQMVKLGNTLFHN